MDDTYNNQVAAVARMDFERARRKAFFTDLVATLHRRPNWLLSFEEVRSLLDIRGQYYKGMEQVPVANIVGSVDRYHDFDRQFLPSHTRNRPRWESVDRAALTDVILPPVQLYKVGSIYFVKDGNHRVSVAREKGAEFIDAEVIECPTSIKLSPNTDPRDLLRLAEYARFLEQTKLDKLRPDASITFSSLGRYDVLLEHISAHRWFMGIEQNRPISWEEAVTDWYDNVYKPVVDIINENNVLDDFPGHTAGDLYLWIMDHRWYLREATGEELDPLTAVITYGQQHMSWTRKVVHSLQRLRAATSRPLVVSARRIARALKATQAKEEPSS